MAVGVLVVFFSFFSVGQCFLQAEKLSGNRFITRVHLGYRVPKGTIIIFRFGALLNSEIESITEELEVDHILDLGGEESKTEEMYWLLTNLQYLKGKDNILGKYAQWVRARGSSHTSETNNVLK